MNITTEHRESIQSLQARLDRAKAYPEALIIKFWDRELKGFAYRQWFRTCLNRKINRSLDQSGRKYSEQYQIGQMVDARIIRENRASRIRRSGRNILNTPELKRRYPDIDNSV